MNLTNLFNSEDRAVSPVIGVILMVAITVILAAVIGTFVLGLGDQVGDSAPQASFSTTVVEYDTGAASADGEELTFTMEKTGGQDLESSDLTLSVDGDRISGSINDATTNGEAIGTWQTGASYEFAGPLDADKDGDRVTIRLIHTPTGDQVYQTTVTVPDDVEST